MHDRFFRSVLCLFVAGYGLWPLLSPGAVIFKPGEKAKYEAPGEEEMSGNAQELFEVGQKAEIDHNNGRAIKAYRTIVRQHPKDALAASAAFRAAVLLEKEGDALTAAKAYLL